MIQKSFISIVLLCVSFIALADQYPINHQIDVLHYNFGLNLSDNSDEIAGKTKIRFVAKADNVSSIRLDLINISDSLKGKGMRVNEIHSGQTALDFTHSQNALIIQLGRQLKKGELFDLEINYQGIPAGGLKIGPTKYGDRSFFNENWPNNTRQWLPTIDHPYEKATSEFVVTAPSKYKVVSNGLLLEESQLTNGMKLTHWKQSVPVSSWLYVLGVAEFAVQYVDRFGEKSIETWVYPKDRETGFKDFAEPTKEVLAFYSDYVGPFAYEKLANIQSPSVSGGMETSSAIFYAENLVTGKQDNTRLRNVVIHEIAHQWFGNAITETTWDDAWLSEGFATFFTLLFQEHAYGHEEYNSGLLNAKKWIYDYSKKDPNFSIVSDRTAELQPVTSGITYQKGAWFLHMLREKMGHEAFQKGIRSYYIAFFNANATTKDFLHHMEDACHQDLEVFFKQWLYQPDNIKLTIHWKYNNTDKKLEINIEQVQPSGYVFEFPLEWQAQNKNGKSGIKQVLQIKDAKSTFSIPMENKPDVLVFDPRNVLLAEIELN